MLISTLTLYSTPFTPSYRNVLTGRTSALSDHELKSVFTKISKQRGHEPLIWGLTDSTTKSKSFKYRNSRCVVNVPYLCNDLLSYNYCVTTAYNATTSSDDYTYWFVESIESLNDSTTTSDTQRPCTSITLLRDCWTNNEKELHNVGKTMEYQMGHNYNDLTVSQATIYNTLPPLQYDFQDYRTPYIYNNRYQVLWAKYTLDSGELEYDEPKGEVTVIHKITAENVYIDGGAYPMVLVPFLIYDCQEQKYITDYSKINFVLKSSLNNETYSFEDRELAVVVPSSSHILKAELTFCVPFHYNFTLTTHSPKDEYTATIQDYYILDLKLNYSDQNDIGKCVFYTSSGDYATTRLNNYNDFEYIEINTPTVTTPIKIWDETELKNNYYCQKFPYSFKSIYCNNQWVDLFVPHDYSFLQIKYYRYRNFPCYQIEYTDKSNTIIKSQYQMITNNGELLTRSTAYESYMRNNGNSELARIFSSMSNSVSAILHKNFAGGIAQYANTAVGELALMGDLINRQDLINSPSYDANGAIYNQDLLLCFDCKPNNLNQDLIATTSQRFGSNTPFVKPFNAHYARNFEYAEIPNPNITLSNADDTIIINNALNKGLTQWLVDYPDNPDYFTEVDIKALAYLNTNVSNPYFTA